MKPSPKMSEQEAFDYVKKDLKQLHRLLRGNLSASKWEKILRFTGSISKHVPIFYNHLEDSAKTDLKHFVEKFPDFNPNNDATDIENFTRVDESGYSVQKEVDKHLNKLICELNMANITTRKAA